MKRIGVIIAFLVIISLLLVPLAACQGELKAEKLSAQIVVCNSDYLAVGRVTTCDWLYLLGSGFPPDECVAITICDTNCVWCEFCTNYCGAFSFESAPLIWALDAEDYAYLCENYESDTVSVRAWIQYRIEDGKFVDGKLWASWPLYISCPETCPELQ